ncbi:MAG: S-layer homology domain-containing protein [Candidatus Cohnella colombiensis]|uniref:S-layer homology domain-containing protein n=1 Tax=Candidatus Cohnella colombiensis TaxID=3121368 RepID=A0AA95EZF0_9BACL|nr:MAG: S-layer homology domain-containing protein [Cohnella sp.]
MNKSLKQIISGVAVVAVLGTGITWSTATTYAATTPFPDVVTGHWAQKHIAKLALQKILIGDQYGKFNPNSPVTRQEAILIALRFMGIAEGVPALDTVVLPSDLTVKSNYFKPYVNYAIQKNIISLEEERVLARSDSSKDWGSSPASREWISRLLVRAIGKDAEAKATPATTTFSDNLDIAAAYRNYVSYASQIDLIKGTTVNGVLKFQPKVDVTRAMASTLFSRAESKTSVKYAGQDEGTLVTILADKLTIMRQDGTKKDYPVTGDTSFYMIDSDTASSLAGLVLYGKAIIIPDANGNAAYVEQTDSSPQVKTVEGTFDRYTASKNRVTVLVGDQYEEFYYDAGHLPTVTDATGQKIAITDIPRDAAVKLSVEAARPDYLVSIAVKQSLVNKSGAGTVATWNAATLALQVKDGTTGETESYQVAANATIQLNGVNLKAEQLLVNSQITYVVKQGIVTAITIIQTEKATVSGVFRSLDKKEMTISYTVNGKLAADFMSSNVKVKIDGFTDAGLEDLYAGDAVTLSYDEKDKVTQIAVTNRSVQMLYGATVAGYLAKTKTLSMLDGDGKTYNLILGDNVRYDFNGIQFTAEQALAIVRVEGKRLTIAYSGQNAVFVSLLYKYEGIVLENNTTTKTLKLSLQNGTRTESVKYATPSVEIYNQTNKTYTDVKAGDQVTIIMSTESDLAGTIYVHTDVQYEVLSVDVSLNKLKVRKVGTTSEESWNLTSAVALTDENGIAINLGELTVGGLINVNLQGKSPVKISAINVTLGKVAAIDPVKRTLDIVTLTGTTVTRTIDASAVIKRDSVTLPSLSSIKVNDLVEVGRDVSGKPTIEVAAVVTRKFWKYDSLTKVFYVKASADSSTNYFNLHPNVNIHQGTKTLTVSDLKDSDEITLYVLRGLVVEIVK